MLFKIAIRNWILDTFKKINTLLTKLFPDEVLVPETYQLRIDAAPYVGSPIAYYEMAKLWNNQSVS